MSIPGISRRKMVIRNWEHAVAFTASLLSPRIVLENYGEAWKGGPAWNLLVSLELVGKCRQTRFV
jgi:hypothetical protein